MYIPTAKEVYLECLKKFDLEENYTKEELKNKKKAFCLMYHPDKNKSNPELAK